MKTLEEFLKVGKLYQYKKTDLYVGDNLFFDHFEDRFGGGPSFINIEKGDIVLILKLEIDCSQNWKYYSLYILKENKILERYFSETSFLESMILDTFQLLS